MRNRELLIVAGAERSGKTFFTEKRLAGAYKGAVIVYNVGMPSDFAEYIPLRFLDIQETERRLRAAGADKAEINDFRAYPELMFYEVAGKVYKIDKLPIHLKSGARFKVYRSTQIERLIFKAVRKYAANTLFILDDCRPLFRHGLPHEFITLASQKNHVGIESAKIRGADIACIFHSLDRVNAELYDYATGIVLFNTRQLPEGSTFSNPEIFTLCETAYHRLKELPKYSRAEISMREEKVSFIQPK